MVSKNGKMRNWGKYEIGNAFLASLWHGFKNWFSNVNNTFCIYSLCFEWTIAVSKKTKLNDLDWSKISMQE